MLTEGQILEGKYRVERVLGQGGMGAVFLGQHTTIKRKVAIKVLHAKSGANADTVRRFEKEAQAAGQIGSDHIVEVLDLGSTPDGDRFMVMELLEGQTLTDRIREKQRLTPVEAAPLVVQLLEGLAAAHAAGIVHRDLKPDNVFILKEKAGRRDFVKIVDFGVSKFASLEGEAGQATKDGAVMGTPFYMSPEQARSANEADARSDLYSVGVILFETVTGAKPFSATTFADLLFKIVFEEPVHPTSVVPHLDPEFADLVMKAMARDPGARFQTARELQTALHQWLVRHAGAASFSQASSSSQASLSQASFSQASSSSPASGHAASAHPSSSSPPSMGSQSSRGAAPSGAFAGTGTAYVTHQPGAPALPFAHPGAPPASGTGPQQAPLTVAQAAPAHPVQHPYAAAPSGPQHGPQLGQDTHKAWDASVPTSPTAGKPQVKKSSPGVIVAAAIAAMVLGTGAAVWLHEQPAPPAAPTSATLPVTTTTESPSASIAAPAVEAKPSVSGAATASPAASAIPAPSAVPSAAPVGASSSPARLGGPHPGTPSGATPPGGGGGSAKPAPPAAPAAPVGPGNVKDYGY